MVEIPRIAGLFSIIPASLLLTVIFFVLVVIRKTADKSLKTLGKVVVVLLSIAIVLFLCVGLYILATGTHPLIRCPTLTEMQAKMPYTPSQPPASIQDIKHK